MITSHGTKRSRMLKLTRNTNESIIIGGDDIKITVLSDARGQVKLGIEAPDDVEIWRDEIYEKIQQAGDDV
jgi:carbon storage regulator